MKSDIEISVQLKTNWASFWLIVVVLATVGIVAYSAKQLAQLDCVDILFAFFALCLLLICLLFYFVQSGAEIAKKALELNIELEKKNAADAKRREEDKKCDEASKRNQEQELNPAKIERAMTIRVEVGHV